MITQDPISKSQPKHGASCQDWVAWYWSDFLPAWVERARDPEGPGYFDLLDENGQPLRERKSVLANARLLFTFAHMALLSGNPAHIEAARVAKDALIGFRKPSGLFRRGSDRLGRLSGVAADEVATSYDQCFVILGLSTWGKLFPEDDVEGDLESLWSAIETFLVDPKTGLLLEDDGVLDPADPDAPPRAQNPHMHLYEAALQAFEMTRRPVWLERAMLLRAKGLAHFFENQSGTITEFIAPDLSVLPGRDGMRREIGHQCEWAWLLIREADLGGDAAMRNVAERLLAFADEHGVAREGVMQGAVFDAVSSDTSWREDRFLLWPQTEAIKTHAIRSARAGHGEQAQALTTLVFERYFAGRDAFVNQLDPMGAPIWSEALSRLHYHLVLGLTEGARAGLWSNPE